MNRARPPSPPPPTARRIGHPGGAEVVFDYSEPREAVDPEVRAHAEERAARVAAIGEPFLSFFRPADLHAQLRGAGFTEIDDLHLPGIAAHVTGQPRQPATRKVGGHVLFAATPPRRRPASRPRAGPRPRP